MCYYLYELSLESPGESSPCTEGNTNDGSSYDSHDHGDHVSNHVVATPRQNVGNHAINPGCNGNGSNSTGARCLYGSSATDIALVNISRSILSGSYTVHHVFIGACRWT